MVTDRSIWPAVSVIIPTRNRSELLFKCLASLVNQSINRSIYEVIVVDNGLTDNTKAAVEEFSSKLNLLYCYEAEPGLHIGRHAGLRESKSEILSYIDDDVEVYPTWLESIIDAFVDVDVVMVGGNNIPMFVQSPPVWLKKMWDTQNRDKHQLIPALSVLKKAEVHKHYFSPYSVWGCNFSIRKSTLLEASGFHPDGMPKELI
jgi:glucosyl-dolichyl phosphate glucuronosyltransferase